VGNGVKFSDEVRPFPISPPVLNLDPEEYGEFVMPDVKEFTPEEIKKKVEECFDEIWAKYDADGSDVIGD